jgi:hypothetical protein
MEKNREAYFHGYRFVLIVHSKRMSHSHHEYYRTLRECGQFGHDLESTGIFVCAVFELRPDGTMVKL